MSNNLKLGLGLVAAVCFGGFYAGYKKFSSSSNKLSVQMVEQIMRQIKFQMFSACILFSEGVKKNVLSRMPNDEAKRQQIKDKIKDEILEVFEDKQRLILLKYKVSKEDFESIVSSPDKHGKHLAKIEEEIENLMLDAIAGKLPDLTVPEKVKKAFPIEKAFVLYREMLIAMIEIMVKAFKKQLQNPEFNLADEEDYLRVIRSIHVYQNKEKFFDGRGFDFEDPNLTFSKLMEQYKRRDQEFNEKTKLLEKAYEGFVQSLSAKVQDLNFEQTKANFETFRYSKELQGEEGYDMPEPPEMSWQPSSSTQRLADWTHTDKQLTSQISDAIKRGKVQVQNSHQMLSRSSANEMLGTERVTHDFSKKTQVEEAVASKTEQPIVEPPKHVIEHTVHESEAVKAQPERTEVSDKKVEENIPVEAEHNAVHVEAEHQAAHVQPEHKNAHVEPEHKAVDAEHEHGHDDGHDHDHEHKAVHVQHEHRAADVEAEPEANKDASVAEPKPEDEKHQA